MTDARILQGLPAWARMLAGFISGFLATLVFHQLTLVVLWAINFSPLAPFPMQPTSPFGVPAVFSLAFWGGVWGIIYILVHHRFPGGSGYWLTAFLFGAVFPSLVALFVVLPLKGLPVAGGWKPALLVTAFLINGAWGIGTGVFLKFIFQRYAVARSVSGVPGHQPPAA
jgi:hypothetical protein